MKKQFSVVVAAYNREKYIRQTIESVLQQDFSDYEFIIVDDGSTDGTWDIIQSFGNRIVSLRQSNQGAEATYIKGASLATGEYLAFLDSDDLFFPNALSIYNRMIRKTSSPAIIMGAMKRFADGCDLSKEQDKLEKIEYYNYKDYLSKTVSMGLTQSIIVIRRSIFEEAYSLFPGRKEYIYANDYHLMLQVGTHGPCIVMKQPITIAYRQHAAQNSLNAVKMGMGILSLIDMVRRGQCFGGKKRNFDKYAYLGGPIVEWTQKSFKAKKMEVAFSLLARGLPMIAAAVIRKFICRLKKTTPLAIPIE